jgi:hypothetical protein
MVKEPTKLFQIEIQEIIEDPRSSGPYRSSNLLDDDKSEDLKKEAFKWF